VSGGKKSRWETVTAQIVTNQRWLQREGGRCRQRAGVRRARQVEQYVAGVGKGAAKRQRTPQPPREGSIPGTQRSPPRCGAAKKEEV